MHWRRDDISDPAFTTCRWILKHQSYKKWYKDQRGFLWIKRNPGAGKSTVLKYAFEAAKRSNEGLILASFFFHGRGSLIQKSPLGLFRSLLHQILQQVPGLLTEFASLYRQRCDTEGPNGQKWDWRERDLQIFISSHVAETAKTLPMRLYIDALDECGQESAINLVEYFYRLAGSVAICFACRRYPIVSLEEDGIEISVELGNFPDIEAYISNRIQHVIQDEKVASSIRHELIDRSASNLQWVVLVTPRVITSYKKGKSLKQICMLIRGLPSELATLYENIIRRTEPDDMRQALHLFQWICFAFRPLTLQEIREATALDIHSSHTSLQESRTSGQYAESDEEMERRVFSLSQGLAEVEKHGSERIVQFIHQSVMDFLLEHGFHLLFQQLPDDRMEGGLIARGHFWISRACIKYISMDEVTSFRARDLRENAIRKELPLIFVLAKYAHENWTAHLQIVEQENVVQDDLIALFHPTSSVFPALQEWNGHKHDLNKLEEWTLYGRDRGATFFPGTTLIHIASRFGLLSVVNCILNRDTRNTEVSARAPDRQTPLHYAADAGHEAIVRQLLKNKAEKNARDARWFTPIYYAAYKGHKSVVNVLLEAEALKGDYRQSPLCGAVLGGHTDIVELLLNWGADADTVNEDGENPLFLVVRGLWPGVGGCSDEILELLLENGAEVNTTSAKGYTPILVAVLGNKEGFVKLLLEYGANPDSAEDNGATLLQVAAHNGCDSIVGLLLEEGAQVNTKADDGRTPISWAVETGSDSVVRLLLEHGADPDSVTNDDISNATWRGRHSAVKVIQCAKEGKAPTTRTKYPIAKWQKL